MKGVSFSGTSVILGNIGGKMTKKELIEKLKEFNDNDEIHERRIK